jgi:uncharacterized protein
MRDGVRLATTVALPAREPPVPAVLFRTPYGRHTFAKGTLGIEPEHLRAAGYAVVAQDVRGRGDSQGTFGFLAQERQDGQDTLRWLLARPWSDGRVATVGASYPGRAQLLLADGALKPVAIAPAMAGLSSSDTWWPNGVLDLSVACGWIRDLAESHLGRLTGRDRRVVRDLLDRDEPAELVAAAGDAGHPVRRGVAAVIPYLEGDRATADAAAPGIASLHVTGWFDGVVGPTTRAWREACTRGDDHHLVIGPWTHSDLGGALHGRDFPDGSAADCGLAARHLAFLDHHVRDRGPRPARAEVYVTGANEWRRYDTWPPPGRPLTFFACSDGRLRRTLPPFPDRELTLARRDRDPVPSMGGASFIVDRRGDHGAGPADIASLARRGDVLLFRSEPLASDVEIAGNATVTAFIETRGTPAAIVAKLADGAPDGSMRVVCDGVAVSDRSDSGRARVSIRLSPAHHRFHPGHRVALMLSLTESPRYLLPRTPHDATQLRVAGTPPCRIDLPELP